MNEISPLIPWGVVVTILIFIYVEIKGGVKFLWGLSDRVLRLEEHTGIETHD